MNKQTFIEISTEAGFLRCEREKFLTCQKSLGWSRWMRKDLHNYVIIMIIVIDWFRLLKMHAVDANTA
jgi:hypothetical protein